MSSSPSLKENLNYLLEKVFTSLFHSRLVRSVNMGRVPMEVKLVLQQKVVVENMLIRVTSMAESVLVKATSIAPENTKERIVNRILMGEMDKMAKGHRIICHPSTK